ncbi:MAG: PAS domain-containing protein [Alphaproteobacteria bacterium]|nr:PAS domain-containing protein [Alphaproteobacteria bacterium]
MNHLKPVETMVSERNRALHEIWKSRAEDRVAPRRGDITLSLVRTLTPWMWMVDVLEQGKDFRFRLSGDNVNQFLGGNYTGQSLSLLPHSRFVERVRRALAHCVEHKEPVALGPVASGYAGKEHWEVEIVALPLSEDGQAINCLMGAIELWPLGTHEAIS